MDMSDADTSDAGSDDHGSGGNDSDSDGNVPQQAQAGRGRGRGAGGRGRGRGHAGGQRGRGRPRGGGGNVARMQRDRRANVMTDLHMADAHWVDANNTAPVVHPFRTAAEVLVDTTDFKAVDYFKLYLDDDLINHIVTQTNKYADDYIRNPPTPLKGKSRCHDWIPTNAEEIQTFLGLTMLMGIIHKPSIALYWSTDPLYSTPLFSQVMLRNRYQIILKFFHLNDNDTALPRDNPDYDRLHKLRPFIDHMFEKFQTPYVPGQHMSLDEAMVLWKGQLSFKQFIHSKRTRFGIKVFQLCEDNGYTYRFRIYTGQGMLEDVVWSKTETLVLDMMQPLLGLGYELDTDNYYTTPHLLKHLHENQTNACGTARKNITGFPKKLIARRVELHHTAALRNDQLLAIKYKDSKDVLFLSKFHAETVMQVRKRGRRDEMRDKPVAINTYNQFMGGVDKTIDTPLQHGRRSLKWYKKLTVYLLQLAMVNAHVLYCKQVKKVPFLNFVHDVVGGLLFNGGLLKNIDAAADADPLAENIIRLTGRHFIEEIPQTGRKARPQKRCRVCTKAGHRRDGRYHCADCPSKPGLHMGECFRAYHTKIRY
ncbi:piggyBac transposable element-derived protein 4-like [Lineus longissimus]|uniref:piggyBac transposable element-derived protein 4-like n=1 Tax=Lineus longissimus TaxID=88925 RepID=UPI00315D15CA